MFFWIIVNEFPYTQSIITSIFLGSNTSKIALVSINNGNIAFNYNG